MHETLRSPNRPTSQSPLKAQTPKSKDNNVGQPCRETPRQTKSLNETLESPKRRTAQSPLKALTPKSKQNISVGQPCRDTPRKILSSSRNRENAKAAWSSVEPKIRQFMNQEAETDDVDTFDYHDDVMGCESLDVSERSSNISPTLSVTPSNNGSEIDRAVFKTPSSTSSRRGPKFAEISGKYF